MAYLSGAVGVIALPPRDVFANCIYMFLNLKRFYIERKHKYFFL